MRYAKEKPTEPKLIPMTVRFTEDAMNVLDEVATKNHLSKAAIVRIACDNRLIEYLSSVLYIDEKTGDKILEEMMNIGTDLSGIRKELNRIGVNYSQEVRLRNIEAKYGKRIDSPVLMKQKDNEIQKVKKDCNIFTKNEFKKVMQHFDKMSTEMGKRIHKLIG